MRLLLFLVFMVINKPVLAQLAFFNESSLKISASTKKFIAKNQNDPKFMLESCAFLTDCEDFHYHKMKLKIKGNANEAFSEMLKSNGKKLWSGKSSFDLVYDENQGLYFDQSSKDLPNIGLNQVYFLELSITPKVKIPVAFKIVIIDPVDLILAFSYLDKNESRGIQQLSFHQQGEYFEIIHETRFKSESDLRDVFLYKPFHKMLLNDFYQKFENNLLLTR